MRSNLNFGMRGRKGIAVMLFTLPFIFSAEQAKASAVTDWNTIASTTIVQNGGKSPGASAVWFAYSSLAVYDAVNAITRQNPPFYYTSRGPRGASIEAAAAAAAHSILVHYFPAQQAALDADLATSLASVADAKSKAEGVAVGEEAAAAVINARLDDGLEADVTYVPGSGPGAWVPTPPAFAAPVTPWLGVMRPFTMKSASEFLPGPPPALTSEVWQRDYVLTQDYGDKTSTVRSSNETEIGIFWTEHTAEQYARAFNYLAANYRLSTADSARMMAMLWTGYADAAIGCFNAKYKYGFWRPVTAIPEGGGNGNLTADPAWLPLATTPAHPDYPAAHACITGAVTSLIADYFGTTAVNVVVDSTAFSGPVHQHVFVDTSDLMDEVFWARIYAGLHFYHSLEVGRQLGENVARQVRPHFFPNQTEN